MSTSKTKAYKLHKWEGEDNVSRVEFNENFEKVDKKLKDIDDRSNDLYDRTDALNNKLLEQSNELKKSKAEISNEIKAVDSKFESKINAINSRIATNSSELNTIESKIDKNKNLIDANSKKVDIHLNKLNNDLNLNNKNINDLNRKNSSIEYKQKSDYKKLDDKINDAISTSNTLIRDVEDDLNTTIDIMKIQVKNLKRHHVYSKEYNHVNNGVRNLNIKKGKINSFEINTNTKTGEPNKNIKLIISDESGLVSIKIEKIGFSGWFVTGPFVKNRKTYYGSWYSKSTNSILGKKEGENITRGAIWDDDISGPRGIFGNGINAYLNVKSIDINEINGNLIFNYDNYHCDYPTTIKIWGLGY